MSWKYRLDFTEERNRFDEDELTAEQVAQLVAKKVHALVEKCAEDSVDHAELRNIAETFECEVDSVDSFDDTLRDLYDWGDEYRCWIEMQ